MEGCTHNTNVLLGGMKTCSKATATTENVVNQERQGEVGYPTTFKRIYSLENTTSEKLVAGERPEDYHYRCTGGKQAKGKVFLMLLFPKLCEQFFSLPTQVLKSVPERVRDLLRLTGRESTECPSDIRASHSKAFRSHFQMRLNVPRQLLAHLRHQAAAHTRH